MLLQMAIISFFLWLSSIPLYLVQFIVYMYHMFFIHLSVDEHLVCFQVLAVVNSAPMNIEVNVSFLIGVFCLNVCPKVGLLDHMATLYFFEESSNCSC